jgi:hypothetical protein
MSVLYPLAIINTASITSLVRTALYHHSIRVYPARVETNEDVAGSHHKPWSDGEENPVTPPVSDIPGGETVKDRMPVE